MSFSTTTQAVFGHAKLRQMADGRFNQQRTSSIYISFSMDFDRFTTSDSTQFKSIAQDEPLIPRLAKIPAAIRPLRLGRKPCMQGNFPDVGTGSG